MTSDERPARPTLDREAMLDKLQFFTAVLERAKNEATRVILEARYNETAADSEAAMLLTILNFFYEFKKKQREAFPQHSDEYHDRVYDAVLNAFIEELVDDDGQLVEILGKRTAKKIWRVPQ